MRVSKFYLSTLKEAPAEAEVLSQQLMLRAGLIKKLGSGLYTWMPLGLITLRKVEQIVREEMNRAGALELVMPVIQPAELWQETGRWDEMGPNMLRLKDRHERDFVVAPTHEEVITDIVRREIRSYRQLPVNFYQIQTKFRDEIRPRFGVMRAREFIMKDAYSFDVDEAGMMGCYRIMYDAYTRIFTRMGLKFRAVDADNGAIGGHGVARVPGARRLRRGRDRVQHRSGYAANVEKAEALAPAAPRAAPVEAMTRVPTPGKATCEDVAQLLGLAAGAHDQVPDGVGGRPRAHAAGPRRSHGERGQDRQARPAWTAGAGRPRPRSSRPPAASRATWVRLAFPATCRSSPTARWR